MKYFLLLWKRQIKTNPTNLLQLDQLTNKKDTESIKMNGNQKMRLKIKWKEILQKCLPLLTWCSSKAVLGGFRSYSISLIVLQIMHAGGWRMELHTCFWSLSTNVTGLNQGPTNGSKSARATTFVPKTTKKKWKGDGRSTRPVSSLWIIGSPSTTCIVQAAAW